MRTALDHRAAGCSAVVVHVPARWWPAWRKAVFDRAALVGTVYPVLDEWLAVTAQPTAPKIGVEAFQALGRVPGEQQQRHVAEHGADVIPNDPLVVHAGRRVQLVLPKPAVQQGAEGRLRTRDFSESASAWSRVRIFSASFWAARSDRSLPGFSIVTESTSTRRSPVAGSFPADTRT
jgi:hypothetical protein